MAVDVERAQRAIRELLLAVGEDPDREGLTDTPARVARSFSELFAGLDADPAQVLATTFDIDHSEMIIVRDIADTIYGRAQQRLRQIAEALEAHLQVAGVIVVVECEHLCMSMRGVRKPGTRTITSAVRGQLRDAATRAEAMALIMAPRH